MSEALTIDQRVDAYISADKEEKKAKKEKGVHREPILEHIKGTGTTKFQTDSGTLSAAHTYTEDVDENALAKNHPEIFQNHSDVIIVLPRELLNIQSGLLPAVEQVVSGTGAKINKVLNMNLLKMSLDDGVVELETIEDSIVVKRDSWALTAK